MTRRLAPLLAVLLLGTAGCADSALVSLGNRSEEAAPDYEEDGALWDDDDDDGAGGGDDDDAPPAARILYGDPAPDSTNHNYRDPIVLGFDGEIRGASIRVFSPTGVVPAQVTWTAAGDLAVLTPTEWLDPDTEYEVELLVNDTGLSYFFRTSEVGIAPTDPAALAGNTYALDLASARVVTPSVLDSLAVTLSEEPAWLWQVAADTDDVDAFVMRSGFGVEDEGGFAQDQCSVGHEMAGGAAFEREGSYFSVEKGDLAVWVGDTRLFFEEASIDGDFTADGSGLDNVGLTGWLHLDSADPLAGGEGAACDLLTELIGACDVCPSGAEPCLFVELDRLTAVYRADLDLAPISVDEVDADGECSGATEVLSCSSSSPGGSHAGVLFGLLCVLAARPRRP